MVLQATPTTSTGPDAFRYDEKSDFTGGLNLRADQFNIGFNESPALLNVSVDPRGGVRRRNGVKRINSNAPATDDEIIKLMTHYESGDNNIVAATKAASGTGLISLYYMAYNGSDMNFSGPLELSSVVFGFKDQVPSSATFNGKTYFSNGGYVWNITTGVQIGNCAFSWTGGTDDLVGYTQAFDGTSSHFPMARYISTWQDRMFAAHINETDGSNRIRWSSAGDPTTWAAADYIDVDTGEDGDFITAIIPDGTRLLIFKQNSVYQITGFGSETFQLRNITRTVGNRDGCQPVAATMGVFFWYGEEGVYILNQQNLAWAFERIHPALTYDVGQPALTLTNAPSLMWFQEKLWVSVDYQSDDNLSYSSQDERRNTFMWDPSLGDTGAWVRYDINARQLLEYRPSGATHHGIGVTSEINTPAAFTRISRINVETEDVDTYVSTAHEIESYYQTGWFIGNRPTFPKRWGKTRTVLLADNDLVIDMYIYKDYDLSGWVVPSYYKTVTGLGSPAVWDTAKWYKSDQEDPAEWAAEGTQDRYLFARWPTIGTAQAISLRFGNSPTSDKRGKWGLTSVIGLYRTRRLR